LVWKNENHTVLRLYEHKF
jgi:hypothetical protein